MKTALSIAAVLLLVHLFLPVYSQNNLQNQAIVLKRMIERNHIAPRTVNDQFSADFIHSFINRLDPDSLYFTQGDIDGFEKYRTLVDDELQNRGWAFFPNVINVYKKRLQQADTFVIQLTQKPFEFNSADYWNLPSGYAANEQELKNRWSKLLKFEVLSGLSSVAERQLKNIGIIKRNEILLKEADARNKARKSHQQKINRILNYPPGFEQYCAFEFLSTLATCFDPHTNYFDAKGMKEFETELNTEGFYFGFYLKDNEKNEIVISNLMPGSAAWRCGQLNKDDVLVQIQFEGQEPVDLSASTAREANEMIDESNSNKVILTVRKTNGAVASVGLHKEKVENSNQHVKSFILSGKHKIGYIYLPGFYTTWDDEGVSSCASDMAKEIVKLKKDGIEGIILDVRFNGGGSMQEALELAGIFIEDGPLCQFKTNDGKVNTLKDMNRGTIWDGPMLMMVNGQSASASELVAAVLQDYNRAIIAGSVTHGKGTAQQIVPIDTTVNLLKERPRNDLNSIANGHIKITNGRLYRVTGKTVQGSGVQPDIVLPDMFYSEEGQESHLPFSLKPDTVKRNQYYYPLQPLPIAALKQASGARLSASQKFALINEIKRKSNNISASRKLSLQWSEIEKMTQATYIKENQQKKLLELQTTTFSAGNHSLDKNSTTLTDPINELWLNRLMQDAYVEECYLILSDLIQNK